MDLNLRQHRDSISPRGPNNGVHFKDQARKFTCLMQFYEHRRFVGEAIAPELLGDGSELFVPASPNSSVLVPRWAAAES